MSQTSWEIVTKREPTKEIKCENELNQQREQCMLGWNDLLKQQFWQLFIVEIINEAKKPNFFSHVKISYTKQLNKKMINRFISDENNCYLLH